MIVRPMIGEWSPPSIELIRAVEARRLAVLPIPGLSGDLHQDLGRAALGLELIGSLNTDEARDDFLKQIREKFLAGDPVAFVADIIKESQLEQVLIEELEVEELAGDPDSFRYRIVLREYTEPPAPPAPAADFGADLDPDLDLSAALGLAALDVPSIAGSIPQIGDLLSPLKPAASSLSDAVKNNAPKLLDPLSALLKGGSA